MRNTKVIPPLGIRIKEHLEGSNIIIKEINDDDIYDIILYDLNPRRPYGNADNA